MPVIEILTLFILAFSIILAIGKYNYKNKIK